MSNQSITDGGWEEFALEQVGMKHQDVCGGESCVCEISEIATYISIKISEAVESALAEERQFILNVLDGIDVADKKMGNTGGGTKAIRFALQSRSLKDTSHTLVAEPEGYTVMDTSHTEDCGHTDEQHLEAGCGGHTTK